METVLGQSVQQDRKENTYFRKIVSKCVRSIVTKSSLVILMVNHKVEQKQEDDMKL